MQRKMRGFPDQHPQPSIVYGVTEIPEHLLKRSKSAKAKADGAEAPADAPAGSAPVPATTAAAPAVKAAAPVVVPKSTSSDKAQDILAMIKARQQKA